MAAQTYEVPPAVLVGIMHVEGGRPGVQSANTNGSYDLGPMQINTLWVPKLAKYWRVSETTAYKWIRDDACTNVGVAAWILRRHLNETGSLAKAIGYYHSRTPQLERSYRARVLAAMRKHRLLKARTG
jgi:soluble lytic murein transglycosylase-like protein